MKTPSSLCPEGLTALIDGDRVVMGAAFSAEKVENGVLIRLDDEKFAWHNAKATIERIMSTTKAKNLILYLSNPQKKNFRYSIAKTQPYKANRVKIKRPEHEESVRQYLIKYWGALVVDSIEVDDALGIHQMSLPFDDPNECKTIICSNDKDLNQIPGWHFDVDWGRKRVFKEKEYILKSYMKRPIYFLTDPGFLSLRDRTHLVGGGYYWFCAQLLMGDRVDNIPGIVGPVGAYKLLYQNDKPSKSIQHAVELCWCAYKTKLKHLTIDEIKTTFKEVAQLVWIKRAQKHDKIFPSEWLTC
jgi:5'-3' exonuclease